MIRVGNVYAVTDSEREKYQLNSFLCYRMKGYRYTPAGKKGWDGMIRLVSGSGTFPAGLAPHVRAEFPEIHIVDERARPEPRSSMRRILFVGHELMPHQREAVYVAHEAGRGIIEHAVGGGKSTVAVALTQRCAVPTLVLVHTKELLWQMYRNFEQMLTCEGMLGVIGDGRWEPNLITIGLYQSIAYATKHRPEEVKQLMESRECVIVDEVHHIQAKTYEHVMQQAVNAYYRFGVSATAFKSHDLGQKDMETYYKVVGWTGPVVSRFDEEEGVKAGRLVPADIFIIDYGARVIDAPWQQQYTWGIEMNNDRNEAICQLAMLTPQRPTLILVKNIEHGENLREIFERVYQVQVPYIHGTHSSSKRNRTVQQMRDGAVPILISSVILDEGVDVPNLSTLILAGGGKARHRTKQRIGRGMRAAEGKESLIVFDFADAGKYLAQHARDRQLLYGREEMMSVYHLTLSDAVKELTR